MNHTGLQKASTSEPSLSHRLVVMLTRHTTYFATAALRQQCCLDLEGAGRKHFLHIHQPSRTRWSRSSGCFHLSMPDGPAPNKQKPGLQAHRVEGTEMHITPSALPETGREHSNKSKRGFHSGSCGLCCLPRHYRSPCKACII